MLQTCNQLLFIKIDYNHTSLTPEILTIVRTDQARVQEFVRGGGPKSESLFFFLLFNFPGGGPAQKIAEKMIFSTKK